MIVVKVGGSLFDHPQLGPGLRAYLDALAPADVLLVPGGGDFGDAVRRLDRVHALGEETSHWLALRALAVAGGFLRSLASDPRLSVLDAHTFCRLDDALPHSWDVTSDSIAARAAVVYRAERLVLLKSIDVPDGTPWDVAAERGWVDAHFPVVAAELDCPVEFVNFRRALSDGG